MDGQNLSGQLSDWSVNELLQIMQVTKKTGSLTIEGERRGRIHFKDGAVIGADLTGSRQTYVADDRGAIADVLYVLSSLEKGTFAMSSIEAPEGDGWSVEEILGDVETLEELETALAESGLIEAAGVRVSEILDEPIELSPSDWQIIADLIQPFTFAHLESRFGRGGAVRVLHTLHRLNVAEAMTSEDESAFLDRLAEGISSADDAKWLESKRSTKEESVPDSDVEPAGDEDEPAGKHEPAKVEESVDSDEPAEVEERSTAGEGETEPAEPKMPVSPRGEPVALRGVAADASTTLTDGVYDEIRRLRSKAAEK